MPRPIGGRHQDQHHQRHVDEHLGQEHPAERVAAGGRPQRRCRLCRLRCGCGAGGATSGDRHRLHDRVERDRPVDVRERLGRARAGRLVDGPVRRAGRCRSAAGAAARSRRRRSSSRTFGHWSPRLAVDEALLGERAPAGRDRVGPGFLAAAQSEARARWKIVAMVRPRLAPALFAAVSRRSRRRSICAPSRDACRASCRGRLGQRALR